MMSEDSTLSSAAAAVDSDERSLAPYDEVMTMIEPSPSVVAAIAIPSMLLPQPSTAMLSPSLLDDEEMDLIESPIFAATKARVGASSASSSSSVNHACFSTTTTAPIGIAAPSYYPMMPPHDMEVSSGGNHYDDVDMESATQPQPIIVLTPTSGSMKRPFTKLSLTIIGAVVVCCIVPVAIVMTIFAVHSMRNHDDDGNDWSQNVTGDEGN